MPATLITAHNGADGTPEGSMEFIRHALSSEADVMEIDIRRLAGGRLVFTHDESGDQDISLLSIEEVFHALRESNKLVNCDLKEPGLETAVADLAAQCGVSDRILYSGTVSAGYCMEAGLTNRLKILLNIEEYVPDLYTRCAEDPAQIPQAAREISAVCKQYGIGCVNANYRLATDSFIDILAENGLELSVWTVKTLPEAERFLKRGIYNVTTRNLQEILPLSKRIRSIHS